MSLGMDVRDGCLLTGIIVHACIEKLINQAIYIYIYIYAHGHVHTGRTTAASDQLHVTSNADVVSMFVGSKAVTSWLPMTVCPSIVTTRVH
jgi:hypothetical protein